MKQSHLLLFVLSFLVFDLIGQTKGSHDKLQKRKTTQFLSIEGNEVKRADFVEHYYTKLGLSSATDLVERKSIKGINGWTRTRMQQRHQGLRVVGASYILHEKDGLVKKGSGDILPFISIATIPSINKAEAESAAVQYTNTIILSKTEGRARVLPEWDIEQAELVVMDKAYPEFSGDYLLAYHVIVSNLGGRDQYRESIYVDASSSNVIEVISEMAHTSVEGLANTFYYGEQTIITEEVEEGLFILQDLTRGDGIITLNSSLEDFEDDDNYWDNYGSKEEVSTDAHYCAISFYDYMLDNFSWEGLDGEGFELKSRVYGSENNRVNATWNGSYSTFFSGDCDDYTPLTTMDVVGHEFAHGFTDFTSDLIYRNESGALNESISDILGKGLEFTYDPENSNWLIGARFLLPGNEDGHFRDMENPNNKNHPKLYAGEYWEFGTRDNGGVHINSGVLNHWFYLLSEGKADVNELGVAYDVAKIGFEKATAIVFTMNTGYLTESSTYTKAVLASVEAVKDLYGENSAEMASVLEAWKAVGLYPESGEFDLRVELVEDRASVCADAADDYAVEVYVINVGSNSYLVGDAMELSYELEDDLISLESVTLEEDLMPGDTLFYTFSEVPPLTQAGFNYDIIVFLEAIPANNSVTSNELITTNNSSEGRISITDSAGLDVTVRSVTLTSRSACEVNEESQIRISIQNTGCSEIPEGDYPLAITAAGSEYNYEVRLPFDLRSGSYATIFDLIVVPAEIENGEEITIELSVTDDIDASNNMAEGQYLFLETVTDGYLETFDAFDIITNTDLFIDSDFRADAQIAQVGGDAKLVISGTNDEPFNAELCEEPSLFFRENFQKTDVELCVNTEGMIEPTLSFDLVMHRADALLEDVDQDYAVMLKVSIDEDYEINYPLILSQEEGVSVKHQFELPIDFTDEVLIEVMTLRGDGEIIENGNFEGGDYALLDNLQLSSGPVSTLAIEGKSNVQVSPNPGNGRFYFSTSRSQKYEIFIYDGIGRLQANIKDAVDTGVWDSQRAENGIYFYELIFENGKRESGKIIKNGN